MVCMHACVYAVTAALLQPRCPAMVHNARYRNSDWFVCLCLCLCLCVCVCGGGGGYVCVCSCGCVGVRARVTVWQVQFSSSDYAPEGFAGLPGMHARGGRMFKAQYRCYSVTMFTDRKEIEEGGKSESCLQSH